MPRYNPDDDVADLLAAGFTEAPVELGADGPVSVFSPEEPEPVENPAEFFQVAPKVLQAIGAAYLSVNVERFTDIPKIGLNPKNEYDTPTGLYWYDRDVEHADFATNRKYVIRATLKGVGIDLGKLDDYAVENLLSAIKTIFSIDIDYDAVRKVSGKFVKARVAYAKSKRLPPIAARAAAWWWAITRLAAIRLARSEGRKQVNAWTTVFRSLGIDFVYDPGFGIIHVAEPSQIVSFDPRVIENATITERTRQKESAELCSMFKFFPPRFRFPEDEKKGLTAVQRLAEEGRRPCSSVTLLVVDRQNRTFTRRDVNVREIVAFDLMTGEDSDYSSIPVFLSIDMILYDCVLVSLVDKDGAPISQQNWKKLGNEGFFAHFGWSRTLMACNVFGYAATVPVPTGGAFSGYFSSPVSALRFVEHTVVENADFSTVRLNNIEFSSCYFDKAVFEDAYLDRVSFNNCYLRDASFARADLDGVRFKRCLMEGTNFWETDFVDVSGDAVARVSIEKSHLFLPDEKIEALYSYDDIAWRPEWPAPKNDDPIDVVRRSFMSDEERERGRTTARIQNLIASLKEKTPKMPPPKQPAPAPLKKPAPAK